MNLTDASPRIAWESHGSSGPRVLMIMGMGMRGRVWRPQVEELRRDHQLITFDNRGVGESEEAAGAWRSGAACASTPSRSCVGSTCRTR